MISLKIDELETVSYDSQDYSRSDENKHRLTVEKAKISRADNSPRICSTISSGMLLKASIIDYQ